MYKIELRPFKGIIISNLKQNFHSKTFFWGGEGGTAVSRKLHKYVFQIVISFEKMMHNLTKDIFSFVKFENRLKLKIIMLENTKNK